jgi:GNAT superfamily N-acetyltransferase
MTESRHSLGSRDGYQRWALDSLEHTDIAALGDLLSSAWARDYAGEAYPEFNADLLNRMMAPDGAVAVLVETSAGRPVGFELAMPRSITRDGQRFKTYYVTAFATAPDLRRQGLGRYVLEGINDVVFKQRDADLIFSCFHEGHAGSHTVQATFASLTGHAVCQFARSSLYSRRIAVEEDSSEDKRQGRVDDAIALEAGPKMTILAGPLAPNPNADANAAPDIKGQADIRIPSLAELNSLATNGFAAGFALSESFEQLYLQGSNEHQGSLWFEFPHGGQVWVTYWIVPLAIDQRSIGTCAQLQTIADSGVDSCQLAQAIDEAQRYFSQHGCRAMVLLDAGSVDGKACEHLGFRAGDGLTLAVRGPHGSVRAFEGTGKPLFIDLL